MVVPYLNGLTIPDSWFTTKTSGEIEDYLEKWTKDRKNWPKDEVVSVSPVLDGTIIFGRKMTLNDWELYY